MLNCFSQWACASGGLSGSRYVSPCSKPPDDTLMRTVVQEIKTDCRERREDRSWGSRNRASLNASNAMALSTTGQEDDNSLEAFVKLLIALAVIPADKAATAMAAIATMAH